MVSSASPSVVVKICASTILAPEAAQAPAMIDSRRGWSGAITVSSVTPRKASVATSVASECISTALACSKLRMLDLVRQIDLEPIGRIMAGAHNRRIRGPTRPAACRAVRPAVSGRRGACGRPRNGRRPARLRFPNRACAATRPSSRSRRPGRPRECRRRSGPAAFSAARSSAPVLAKASMVRRSPRSRLCAILDMIRWFSTSQAAVFGLRLVQAETRAELARDLRPGDGMIFLAALGDVMQQQGDIKGAAVRRWSA